MRHALYKLLLEKMEYKFIYGLVDFIFLRNYGLGDGIGIPE